MSKETPKKLLKVVKLCNIKAGPEPVHNFHQNDKSFFLVTPLCGFTHRQRYDDTISEYMEISPVTPARGPDSIAHDVHWFTKDVFTPIGGAIPERH